MSRVPAARSTTRGHHITVPSVLPIAMSLVLSPVLACLSMPTVARAQNLTELNAQIDEVEGALAAQTQTVDSTRNSLMQTIKVSYKAGDIGSSGALAMMLEAEDMDTLLSNAQYTSSLNRKYAQEVTAAQEARNALETTRGELIQLKEEREARMLAQANKDSGQYHYCQWGEAYSDLRYFVGTIGSAGCGLCAYTTVVNMLNGVSYDIPTMLATRGDWYGTEEYVDSTAGSPNGMTHAAWTKDHFDINMTSIPATVADARAALEEGETALVICSGGTVFHDKAGVWRWSGGHYVCIYRCDETGFYVHDSSYQGDAGTAVHYTDEEIANMCSHAENITKFSK